MLLLLVLALFAAPALGRNLKPVPALFTESYIIGGAEARVGQFPHQASLQFIIDRSHTCGASLLAAKWVLTAAHCVGSGASSYQVQIGVHDRVANGGEQGQTNFVGKVTTHPGWENDGSRGFPNDIAVVEMAEAFDLLTPNVKVIKLAKPSDGTFAGKTCQISGWGITQTGGTGSTATKLQWANSRVLTQAKCKEGINVVDAKMHICVSGTGREGVCQGDSGGPLTCNSGTVLAGVTSFGIRGCYPDYPSVYARVSNYESWVKGITGPL